MANLWDRLGNTQALLRQNPTMKVDPFNSAGYVPFGTALDIAKNLPDNPQSYNDRIESARVAALDFAGNNLGTKQGIKTLATGGGALGLLGGPVGAVAGAGLGAAAGGALYGLASLDKRTEGRLSTVLAAGTKNVRSNYAFVSDVAKHEAGLGLLAGLSLIAGGVLGGVGGFLVGGPVGAVAGAGLGVAAAGKADRMIAETGIAGNSVKQSAIYSESEKGQQRYNFGTDVTRLAGKIVGIIPGAQADKVSAIVQDTHMGIGALVSGLINFGFEVSLAPDIKGAQLGGQAARTAFIAGSITETSGALSRVIANTPMGQARVVSRLADDVELIKKTAAGEKTRYTDVFRFYRENDVATIIERTGMRGEHAQIGAKLIAGQSDEVIGLVFRVGRGDLSAIDELATKHAATHAAILRYEGIFDTISARNPFPNSKLPEHVLLGKGLKDTKKVIEAETDALRAKYSWLNTAFELENGLSATAPIFTGLEKWRNDIAKQRNANHMGGAINDITTRETSLGRVVQKAYQINGIGPVIRMIERNTDDAPHSTISFNDNVSGAMRVRTTLRAGVEKQLFPELEARALYGSFLTAKTETEKLAVIKKIEERTFEQVANKYNLPSGIKDLVLSEYLKLTRQNTAKAKEAKTKNNAFMYGEDGSIVRDPQLISQLANGSYLPDMVLVDKAFARYAKKLGEEASLPVNVAVVGKTVLDEFNSMWRNLTLARTGFPINIIRDSTLRIWGDGVLFDTIKNLIGQELESITHVGQTFNSMKRWVDGATDPKKNLGNIRTNIKLYDSSLAASKTSLKKWKYDPAKPPKDMPIELQRNLEYIASVEKSLLELRRQENALVKNIPTKKVGRSNLVYNGVEFPGARSGRYAEISAQKLTNNEDIRGLMASTRELEMAWIRRDRDGGRVIKAIDNEDMHLQAWGTLLNNTIRYDDLTREIMKAHIKGLDPVATEKAVVDWIRSPASKDIVERFGYDKELKRTLRYGDAKVIYQRSLTLLNTFAPDIKLQKLIMEDKANIIELKKMYPDITTRPDVISDLALDLSGNSNFVRGMSQKTKEVVTWLATVPTSRLSYSPYFATKYQSKLQNMVAIANAQGRNLEGLQGKFESIARTHAIEEYRHKINAFNRDMDYAGWLDYTMAFFPAVVEQWRAYGRATFENPEFPLKMMQMANIPEYISNTKIDEYGTEYTEVTLPVLGIKGRLPVSWFKAWNPTGGHIISFGPVVTAAVNQVSKNTDLPKWFEERVLPFGTQSNALGALTPSTVRRAGQAFQSYFLRSGEQFNKDVSMFLDLKRKEFQDENHRNPSNTELADMARAAANDSISLSFIRALGAGILPSQPRYVTGLQAYSDLLSKYNAEKGDSGTELFVQDYPEYFMLADKLTDSTSGLRADDTAVNLVKNNKSTVELLVATVGEKNLSVLGAVFNDADYAFSSAANAYLVDNGIPGTRRKFKEQGAALENARSSIVSDGWNKWNLLVEIVSQDTIAKGYDISNGYGAAILDRYKKAFMEKMKVDNPLWYSEKKSASFTDKRNATIAALTIAANTPQLWKELSKQPRWHTIVDYLNFRYAVYDELQSRSATITSADDIRMKANAYVAQLRKEDINFGKYYDRYLDGDTFDDPTLEK